MQNPHYWGMQKDKPVHMYAPVGDVVHDIDTCINYVCIRMLPGYQLKNTVKFSLPPNRQS